MKFIFGFVVSFFISVPVLALCVSVSKANLRNGPGTKHKINWTVPMYTPLVKLQKVRGWYEVRDQDGKRHWVGARQVTSRYKCVSVATKKASLRTGPSTRSPRGDVWYAGKYIPFRRIDSTDNGWYKVESYWGRTYWIHSKLVWRPIRIVEMNM